MGLFEYKKKRWMCVRGDGQSIADRFGCLLLAPINTTISHDNLRNSNRFSLLLLHRLPTNEYSLGYLILL